MKVGARGTSTVKLKIINNMLLPYVKHSMRGFGGRRLRGECRCPVGRQGYDLSIGVPRAQQIGGSHGGYVCDSGHALSNLS